MSGLGAVAARTVAETLPPVERWPLWLAGSAAIFLGLWIVSLGTRRNDDQDRGET